MRYEVIVEIENNCKRNQLRDVFVEEYEISDTDAWIREKEPDADSVERTDVADGVIYRVMIAGLPKKYILTEAD